jgi:hypothetical protein
MATETANAPANGLSMDVQVVDGMVPKVEFDRAIEAAQQALRAKTASSQQMLAQASSAMRNALTALSLSEQEVANLKATVKELQERPAEGTNEIIEREREELRQAQQRVADLSAAFRQLQGEVARVRYEQEGFDMPVAMSLPVKIAPELASRVTVIAQLVMLGYSYEDGEMALDAVRVNDLHLALEWLEGRHAPKTQFSINRRREAMLEQSRRVTTTDEERVDRTTRRAPHAEHKQRALPPHESHTEITVREVARRGGSKPNKTSRGQLNMYDARKRAVSSMICIAIRPPGHPLTPEQSEEIARRCIQGLARLSQKSSAFMILSLGGNRCAFDCLKLYQKNPDICLASFKLLQALVSNPSTMMHVKKQQRFKLLPNAVSQATGLHQKETDVIAEGAHVLWAANVLGGKIVQERSKASGFLRYVKSTLNREDIDEKDPKGKHQRKMVGFILSLAVDNMTMQKYLVNEGYRALLRGVFARYPEMSFDGEFSSLREWIREEYENPSFAPDEEAPKASKAVREKKPPMTPQQASAAEKQRQAEEKRKAMASRGYTAENLYFAKKRAIGMLCKIALNPPGSIVGVSAQGSEETAYRCMLALARVSERGGAYIVLTCGGPRTAVDCMRHYLHNPDIMYASMRVLRALLSSPTTMIRLLKQVRFKILPSAIMDAIMRHPDDLEMKAEAAHALWAYTGVGAGPARQTVMDCGPAVLEFLKDGLQEALEDVGSNQYLITIRKFLGCILSLAKDDKEIQDKLVEEGMRREVRKALSANNGISFHGEFASLRDWIRGDRGGAKSMSRSMKSQPTKQERNAAERALDDGADEDSNSPVEHIKAQRLFEQEAEMPRRKNTADVGEREEDRAKSRPPAHQRNRTNSLSDDGPASQREAGQASKQTPPKADQPKEDTRARSAAPAEEKAKPKLESTDKAPSTEAHLVQPTGHVWTVNEAISVLKARNRIRHAEASEALADMFANEPTLGIAIVLNGGVAAIDHAMSVGDAAFAAGACALLYMLTTSDLTSKRMQSDNTVLEGPLFTTIVNVMTKHPRNVALQQWGATAVWALVKNNSRGKSAFVRARTEKGVSALKVLKNSLAQFGQESEGAAKACIGCILSLALNSVQTQRAIADLALPYLILQTLSRHPQISFKGEFDTLREWLRDNSHRENEIEGDV